MIFGHLRWDSSSLNQHKNESFYVFSLLLAIFCCSPATIAANIKDCSPSQWRQSTELKLQEDLIQAEQTKPTNNLVIANALINLANFYKNTGNWQNANSDYERALRLRKSILGADNLLVAFTLVDIGELDYLQGKYSEAEPIFLNAISIEDNSKNRDNTALASALEKYAKVLYKLNRESEANTIYTRISALNPHTQTKNVTTPATLNSLQRGILEYNKKNFKQSLPLLLQARKENPKDPNILFYLGNCYFILNQMTPGLETYWALISNFPEIPKASQAKAYLQKIAPDFLEKQIQASTKDSTHKSAPLDSEEPKKLNVNNDYTSKDIIVVLKATGDRVDSSPQIVSALKSTFDQFPQSIRQLLGSHGSKIYITPSTIEKDPRLQNSKPGGYEDGTSWKNCPGFTCGKEVVICTSVMAHDESGWTAADDAISTLRHEIGHEIDYLLGDISESEEYKHGFLLDVAAMDDSTRQTLAYYTQKADAGPHESFAEITCALLGGGSTKWRTDTQKLIMQNFPHSIKYVSQLMQNPKLGKDN